MNKYKHTIEPNLSDIMNARNILMGLHREHDDADSIAYDLYDLYKSYCSNENQINIGERLALGMVFAPALTLENNENQSDAEYSEICDIKVKMKMLLGHKVDFLRMHKQFNKLLADDIWNTGLSVRACNILGRANIKFKSDLLDTPTARIAKLRHMGERTFREITEYIYREARADDIDIKKVARPTVVTESEVIEL